MIGNNINRIIIRWEAFKLGGDVATETDNSKMRALMSLGMHELLLMGGFEHSRSAASVILPLPRVGWGVVSHHLIPVRKKPGYLTVMCHYNII